MMILLFSKNSLVYLSLTILSLFTNLSLQQSSSSSPEIKITSPSTLNIYKPTWYRGYIYNITWKIINTETNVSIYLMNNHFDRINNKPDFQIIYEIANNLDDSQGYFLWNVDGNVPEIVDGSIQIRARTHTQKKSYRIVIGQSSKINIDRVFFNMKPRQLNPVIRFIYYIHKLNFKFWNQTQQQIGE